jgi:hypothetical protein
MRTVLALGRGNACSRGSRGTANSAHEGCDRSTGIDGTAALCAAESRRFAAHLPSTDDGGVGLGTAPGRSAVTGGSILDCIALAIFREEEGGGCVPERPGMVTPLAPWTSVITPWAETEAAKAATVARE